MLSTIIGDSTYADAIPKAPFAHRKEELTAAHNQRQTFTAGAAPRRGEIISEWWAA